MSLEDERVKVLKYEYLQLYKKFQHLKELASSIDLDLLSLSVDLENVPDAKAELDRVHELVHTLLNEEIYPHNDPFDKKLYEIDCEVVEMGDVNSIGNAQNVETDNMKLVENTPVLKTNHINLKFKTEDMTKESDVSQNSETKLQSLDESLVQLSSIFTEQQILDAFVRLAFTKVFSPPKTNQVASCNSQKDLPDAQTAQVSHSLEIKLEETNGFDPVTESLEEEVETTVDEEMQGTSQHVDHVKNSSIEKNELAEEELAQTKHTIIIDDKTLDTSDLQTISLPNLITTGVPDSGEKDDENKESAATVMPTEKIVCERCGVTLENRHLFNQHQKIHAKEDNTCSVCGKQFNQKHKLRTHTQLHSLEKPFPCKICGKRFHTEKYLRNHLEHHDKSKPKVYCEVCGKPFAGRNSLSKHMNSQHGKEKLKCSFCDKLYKNIDALSAHEKRHTEHFPHQCSKCGKGFQNPMQLNVHERIHIGKNPVFTCSICCETFASKVRYNAHKKSHMSPCNLYNCSICQEQFKIRRAMAQHMLTHPEDLQFCVLCQQIFDSPLNLQSHVTRMHLRTFKCSICGHVFSSFYKLSKHKAFHSKADPFKCNDCGKSYATGKSLTIHVMSTHLKIKMHQCEYCGRNFNRIGNFRRHLLSHQGLKPFKCLICGKGFGQKVTLETHSWTHKTDKRYSCQNCGRGFNEKRALLSHWKTQHQDQQDSSEMNG